MKSLATLALLLLLSPPAAVSGGARAPQVAQSQSVEEFLARWKDPAHLNLFQSATWTLTHDYSDFKHVQEVLLTAQPYFDAMGKYEQGDRSALERLGGIKGFKDKLAGWLDHEDQAVRAFAAVLLGVSGDRSYAPRLAALLGRGRYRDNDHIHYDKGRAAMALGMVGAKEHAPRLAALLKSKESYDRAGAAYGLGYLKAKEHARAVAALLDDQYENVREAAQAALEMMGEPPPASDKKGAGTRPAP